MLWEQRVEFATLSDVGFRRQNNQDCATALMAKTEDVWSERGHVFIVADGMGGHAVGELASKIAVDTIPHTFHKIGNGSAQDALKRSIEAANAAIHARGEQNREFRNMGTTCTTLVLGPEGALAGHVGDSRLYRIRDERIDQLTFDHSRQWELIKEGKQKKEDILRYEPRNVITRCLGPEAYVDVDLEGPHPVYPGDAYLLCSDGLTGVVSDSEIGIITGELPPVDACRLLINLANLRGGTDNITVLIAKVGDLPEGMTDIDYHEPVPSEGLGWGWFVSIWGIGILLLVGFFLLFLFEKHVEGVLTIFLGLLCTTGLIWAWWKLPKSHIVRDRDSTVVWKPYSSSPARLNRRFLEQLSQLERTLAQTASEEGWQIDWTAHKSASEKAKQALTSHDDSSALRELAKVLQVLMSGIQHQRRQMDHVAKWGIKTASSKSDTDPATE